MKIIARPRETAPSIGIAFKINMGIAKTLFVTKYDVNCESDSAENVEKDKIYSHFNRGQ